MKQITEYMKVTESRTADFIVSVADCIKDPDNVTDSDIIAVQKMIKANYKRDINKAQAKDLINLMIKDWPELFYEN